MNDEIESILAKIQEAQEDTLQLVEKRGEEIDPEMIQSFDNIMDLLREME